MPDSFTPHYNLTKVGIGESRNTWGTKLNLNFDKIDTGIKLALDAGAAANANANTRLPLAGGTLTGGLRAPSFSNDAQFGTYITNGVPVLAFDASDALSYNRVSDTLDVVIASNTRLAISPTTATLNVPLVLNNPGAAANHAARRDYVDAQIATRMPTTGGTFNGDITTFRANAANTGALFLGNSGQRYLFWDGSNYVMPGGNLFVAGTNAVYHTGNFNPGNYLPLSGGLLSGALTTNGRRLMSQSGGGGGDASVGMHVAGFAASGMLLTNQNILYFSQMDASGNHVGTRGYFDSSNNFVAAGNVAAFSDETLKQDFRPLEGADAIVRGLADAVSRYRWLPADMRDETVEQVGVLAQRVRKALPEAVQVAEDGILSVSDRPMLAALLKSVAALLDRVDALEAGAR